MKKGHIYRKYIRPVKHAMGYAFLRILIWKIRWIPRPLCLWWAALMGRLGYLLLGRDRKLALNNLAIAYPEMPDSERKRLAKEVFRHSAMNLVDIAVADKLVLAEEKRWRVEGEEHIAGYAKKFGGGIVITGHIGCFELMPGICVRRGYKVGVVGRQLFDERIDRILTRQREKMGFVNVPSDSSPRKIIRLIKDGHIVGILMDTNTISVDGRPAPFFGNAARTITGAVALALLLDKPLLPMAIYREGKYDFVLKIWPPIELEKTGDKDRDLDAGLALANRQLEEIINLHPEQWIWYHPRYK